MTRDEALAYLRTCLEHEPQYTFFHDRPLAGLLGWRCLGVTICSLCAWRIIKRGCSLGKNPEPIWDGEVDCDLHPKSKGATP